ncbi:response regulator [Achromobacter sp. GbtcB20]|uniref:response regulator n=1 Tax=Achromobacter sp. GbtcB20 TaxID=2824765 RepID=UPI001266A1D5|nr:response regulator [Achromobacter sp. GbtcB20]
MRVLIVDDDSVSAELTAECLMMEPGVIGEIACDGASALRIIETFAPDVILLDVSLPDTSGLDLAPQLKIANPERPPRIIIFTGSVWDAAGALLPVGVDGWLSKPAHLDDLLACVFRPIRT